MPKKIKVKIKKNAINTIKKKYLLQRYLKLQIKYINEICKKN